MIEFYGEVNEEISIHRAKRIIRHNGMLMSIILPFILLLSIIYWKIQGVWIFALMMALLTPIGIVSAYNRRIDTKNPNIDYTAKLTVTAQTIDIQQGKAFGKEVTTEVVKVYDFGEWWELQFKGGVSKSIICQKDLIVKGTIEEFEEIFAGKIVKKISN